MQKRIRFLTKPLLMPALAFFYLMQADPPVFLLLAAIAFGWLGDLFLMIPDPKKTQKWFKPGLVAFLLGHLFYVVTFVTAAGSPPNLPFYGWILVAGLVLYGGIVFIKLKPHMGRLAVPITVYILVIIAMGISTVLCFSGQPLGAVGLSVAGALIFIISDTVNAWNRFARPIPHERLITMVTYLLGQLLLVIGFLGF